MGRLGIMFGMLALAGCAADEEWHRIGPGMELAQAHAYCDTVSMSAGSSYYASGSPGYVAGVALGGAVANSVAQSRVYHNCMVIQGWQAFPKPKKTTAAP